MQKSILEIQKAMADAALMIWKIQAEFAAEMKGEVMHVRDVEIGDSNRPISVL